MPAAYFTSVSLDRFDVSSCDPTTVCAVRGCHCPGKHGARIQYYTRRRVTVPERADLRRTRRERQFSPSSSSGRRYEILSSRRRLPLRLLSSFFGKPRQCKVVSSRTFEQIGIIVATSCRFNRYRSTDQCTDRARYNDVVHREYGV